MEIQGNVEESKGVYVKGCDTMEEIYMEKDYTQEEVISGKRKAVIEALKQYLLVLIQAEKWCEAKRVGNALETVLNEGQFSTSHNLGCVPPYSVIRG